jgi:hypothetical protein
MLVALLSAALVVVAVTAAVVGADNSQAIRSTSRDNAEALRLIKSCTTPGQECFERGQKQTAEAVADINRVTVYAAACADLPGVQGQAEIYACVVEKLAEDDGRAD